jgi:RNA polymerase sigma-54 factor
MKLSLDLRTSLSQTLTPQQIQYLKLLQLPVIQLEQYLQQEIEQNPMLEDSNNPDEIFDFDDDSTLSPEPEHEKFDDYTPYSADDDFNEGASFIPETEDYGKFSYDDDPDPFDLYSMVWQDNSEMSMQDSDRYSEDDEPHFQIKAQTSLEDDLIEQLNLLHLTVEENILGRYIIGNIDDDGYLRRPLEEIIDDTNSFIAETNFNTQHKDYLRKIEEKNLNSKNPAAQYSISDESIKLLENAKLLQADDNNNFRFKTFGKSDTNINSEYNPRILNHLTMTDAEKVLSIIQTLDPPGIASRDMRECLLMQCKAFNNPTPAQLLASRILIEAYEPFIKKHYQVIIKQLGITEEDIKNALDVIKRLNPKPGGGDSQAELNTVIPDFIIETDEESNELMISLNDTRLPNLKLSKAYETLQKDAKLKKYNKETKNWIRGKREDAKFMIQAIKQRKNTMLKVMTAIATLQKNFFFEGKSGLKPLIYKVVAEETGLDISTVCRIVNGKYVQTEFGTYELKYFFSEALITDDGEDVSTTIIKERIKNMIDEEPKDKPFSDELISKLLKESGFNVARRTVAKYREQMRIPVARLRVEI